MFSQRSESTMLSYSESKIQCENESTALRSTAEKIGSSIPIRSRVFRYSILRRIQMFIIRDLPKTHLAQRKDYQCTGYFTTLLAHLKEKPA
jgi:hypothetical protein